MSLLGSSSSSSPKKSVGFSSDLWMTLQGWCVHWQNPHHMTHHDPNPMDMCFEFPCYFVKAYIHPRLSYPLNTSRTEFLGIKYGPLSDNNGLTTICIVLDHLKTWSSIPKMSFWRLKKWSHLSKNFFKINFNVAICDSFYFVWQIHSGWGRVSKIYLSCLTTLFMMSQKIQNYFYLYVTSKYFFQPIKKKYILKIFIKWTY